MKKLLIFGLVFLMFASLGLADLNTDLQAVLNLDDVWLTDKLNSNNLSTPTNVIWNGTFAKNINSSRYYACSFPTCTAHYHELIGVTAGTPLHIPATGKFTVSYWYYLVTLDTTSTFFLLHDTARPSLMVRPQSDGSITGWYNDGTVGFSNSTVGKVKTGEWQHLVISQDFGNTIKIWIDGEEIILNGVLSSTNSYTNTQEYIFGAYEHWDQSFNGDQNFDGFIDEIYLWNRTSNQTDVDLLYLSGAGDFYPFSNYIPPINSSWNVTSGNVFGTENTSTWNSGGLINITSNLLSLTVTTDENSNGSCVLDHDWNYTTTVANNSNYKFATTETTSHAYTVYDNISLGNHCLYCSFIDSDGNELATSSSGCLNLTHYSLPNITLMEPSNNTNWFYSDRPFTLNFTVVDYDDSDVSCNLYFNDVLNQTNTTVLNNTKTSWDAVNLSGGTHLWNVTCQDTKGNIGSLEYVLNIVFNAPQYVSFNIDKNNKSFCETVNANAIFTDDDIEVLTTYFESNLSGSFVNHTATYNLSTNTSSYNIGFSNHGVGNFSWKLIACDSTKCNDSMPYQTFEVTKNTTTTILYLNGLSSDRKYELGDVANLTGEVNACTNETIYLDILDEERGYNYTNDVDSSVYYNYSVDYITVNQFNDSTSSKYFSLYFINHTYVNLVSDINLVEAKLKVEGFNTSGSYPKDVEINVLNDTDVEVSLPGELRGNKLYKDYFSNGETNETLDFETAGVVVRYINLTANSLYHTMDNISMDLRGSSVDPFGVNFKEYFFNSSYINGTDSINASNSYFYDDYSLGEISGRWNGEHSTYGSNPASYDEYTVTLDSHIQNSISSSGDETCTQVYDGNYDIDGGQTRFWQDDTNLEDYTQITVLINNSAGASCATTNCIASCQAGSSASWGIRNDVGSNYGIITVSAGASASWGGHESQSDFDGSTWTIKQENGYFKVYDDGVYANQVEIESGRHYYLYGYAVSSSTMNTGSSSAQSRFGSINFSGFRGGYAEDLSWGNGTLISTRLHNTTENITRAKLTANVSNPSGGTVNYYLSNTNTSSWESVTNGLMHTFTTQGTELYAFINVTTTDSEDPITINSYAVDVIPGKASNIQIDVAYDGIIEWNYTYEINETNPQLDINFSGQGVNEYIGDNCDEDLTCLVPIAFSSTVGRLTVSGMNFTQNLSAVRFNQTEITNNLSGVSSAQDVIFNFESSQNGSVNLTNLAIQYKGDKNVTINANYFGNENYTSSSDSQVLSWRYSPFNATWPQGVVYYSVYPSSVNSKSVSPYGQYIKSTENISIAIWNITTTAKTDPIKIYRWYEDTVDSCLTLYTCLGYNKTNCTTVNSSRNNLVIQNFNRTQNFKLYDFWNLTACDPTNLYLPGNNTFRGICQDCIKGWS
jgi:hypothetical protein